MIRKILVIATLAAVTLLSSEIVRKGRPENFRFYDGEKLIFGEKIDGKVKAYWDSASVFGEYNYKKGLPDGVQKEFFEDGKISAEWTMKDGKRVGAGKEYYPDGTLSFERTLDSKGNGIGTEYYKNGLKKRERLYQNGVQVHVSYLNQDIKGNRYKRNAEELFFEAQEYGAVGMYGHAISVYEEFLEKYPKHEKAPDVKFLIAFTYHNSLKEEDIAKKHYAEFIKMYPDSPLRISAEFEMENIGKDIENLDMFKGN
jgi:tetratricopeptide (TPR) repeat protein